MLFYHRQLVPLDMQTTTRQLILLDARYHSNSAAIAVGRSVLRTVYLPVLAQSSQPSTFPMMLAI
jgi:hypothetical protein